MKFTIVALIGATSATTPGPIPATATFPQYATPVLPTGPNLATDYVNEIYS